MTGEIEAAGDLATGALLATAVDRARLGGAAGDGALCLNCGTALSGLYCHRCGQPGHVHRTLTALGHDLLHAVLHFEGRAWKTLPMLFWRPGELTRRYVHGERARFVSPLALFLFSVFLMFAVLGALGATRTPEINGRDVAQVGTELMTEQGRLRREIASLEVAQAALPASVSRDDRADVARELSKARDELSGVTNVLRGISPSLRGARDIKLDLGWAPLSRAVEKARRNPSLLIYKLQSSAYKFSWALIPISMPFLWLLFVWRRGHRMYDHAVFITYSISFMTLWVILLSLAGAIGVASGLIVAGALVVPPLHIYRQLRGAYALSRFSAIWRTVALCFFAAIALLLFWLLLLTLGLMG